jgi:hypothetical protein
MQQNENTEINQLHRIEAYQKVCSINKVARAQIKELLRHQIQGMSLI